MSNLYGRVYGEGTAATRQAHYNMTAKLENWEQQLRTTLAADGTFVVYIEPKGGEYEGKLVLRGNVANPHNLEYYGDTLTGG